MLQATINDKLTKNRGL